MTVTSLPHIANPSPNLDARATPVSLVVLHYTGMQSAAIAIKRLCDPAPVLADYPGPWVDPALPPETPLGRVSVHYVVDEAGQIFALVPEDQRAWHAGVSHWAGRDRVNDFSIGIEIVNGGHDFGLPPYPDAQIESVIALVADIRARHELPVSAVVGHSDIAPGRKLDPGEHFPWVRLAEAGQALWPGGVDDTRRNVVLAALGSPEQPLRVLQQTLIQFGYGLEVTGVFDAATIAVIEAFQRRFFPEDLGGPFRLTHFDTLEDMLAQMKPPRDLAEGGW